MPSVVPMQENHHFYSKNKFKDFKSEKELKKA